jgi:tetratricopeptide (TPR) repeat protein
MILPPSIRWPWNSRLTRWRLSLTAALVLLLSPAAWPADVAAPAAPPPSPSQAYFREGQAQEQSGMLVEAARMYKLSLTLQSENSEARQALARVEEKRRATARQRYQEGVQYSSQGQIPEARRSFLAALRYWPALAEALEGLRGLPQGQASRFVPYKVRAGDTLAIIAKRFYGDYRKYTLLAQYNELSDATHIRPGQSLKIPELAEAPFVGEFDAALVEEGGPLTTDTGAMVQAAAEVAAAYREAGLNALQAKDYLLALAELQKAYKGSPADPAIRKYLGMAHYGNAQALWEKGQFPEAGREFETCLDLAKSPPEEKTLSRDCANTYKALLYQRGITFFEAGQPQAALEVWDVLAGLDPHYRELTTYMTKARKRLAP